eukprot:SAG22_NODE_321_length_12398_cov_3.218392_4_plen_40_part_00
MHTHREEDFFKMIAAARNKEAEPLAVYRQLQGFIGQSED